jgi:hypothetical protein
MEIGAVDYGCLPFNGWFMETEIARNLFEETRYEEAMNVARALGLDVSSDATLWARPRLSRDEPGPSCTALPRAASRSPTITRRRGSWTPQARAPLVHAPPA